MHVEDVFADPWGRFVVNEETCPPNGTGWFGECGDDDCIRSGHRWFSVTRVLPDGSGEIHLFRVPGVAYQWVGSFPTEASALAAARSVWPDKHTLTVAAPPRLHEIAKHYGRTSKDVLSWMQGAGFPVRSIASRPPLRAVLAYIANH